MKVIRDLIYHSQGPLTSELQLAPGGHGLGQLPKDRRPDATVTSICGYCSTGCGLKLHLRDGEALGLTPAPGYPVNLGMACPKGWEALDALDSPSRGLNPILDGDAVSWTAALEAFCTRFKAVQQEHGPASVAFLSTGQIPIEEMAYLGVLAKFGMGMVHGDGNTRQCMATAATAYKQSFGFDAPPYSYQDFSESDVLVFVGANPCIAHPIMWERVCHNPQHPDIIVIDPRLTETATPSSNTIAAPAPSARSRSTNSPRRMNSGSVIAKPTTSRPKSSRSSRSPTTPTAVAKSRATTNASPSTAPSTPSLAARTAPWWLSRARGDGCSDLILDVPFAAGLNVGQHLPLCRAAEPRMNANGQESRPQMVRATNSLDISRSAMHWRVSWQR
jgi:hypothetical protein